MGRRDTRPEKMGRRDARQKINREMKHKMKKNGKTRSGQKKGETGRETKKMGRRDARENKADRPANSRKRWAGALMEVRSLFFSCHGRTYGQTNRLIESLVRN